MEFLPGLSDWYETLPGGDDPHDKRLGLWLSGAGAGNNDDNYVDFELDDVTALEQVWIWNQNDRGGEADRNAAYITFQVPSEDPGPGQLGDVTYDVTLGTMYLHDPTVSQDMRLPDIFNLSGTSTRYLRLYGLHSAGDSLVGLGTVLIFEVPEPSTLALLGVGALGLVVSAYRRRRRK